MQSPPAEYRNTPDIVFIDIQSPQAYTFLILKQLLIKHPANNQAMTIDEWENIYSGFEEEMTMFDNIAGLAKNIPDEGGPEIEGCSPEQYRPMLQAIDRIYETIKRLEQEPRKIKNPSTDLSPLNEKIKSFAKQFDIHLVGFTTLEEAWVFPPSEKWTYPQTYREIKYRNVISLGMEMSCEVFNINHFPDSESLFEAINIYAKLGEAIEKIAEYIREQGFETTEKGSGLLMTLAPSFL